MGRDDAAEMSIIMTNSHELKEQAPTLSTELMIQWRWFAFLIRHTLQ